MSIAEAFEKFDRQNPGVYELFVKLTFQLIHAGRTHHGAGAVAERIRWEHAIKTDGDKFKLNNNFRAHYARKFEEDYPQYKGFFRSRRLRTA